MENKIYEITLSNDTFSNSLNEFILNKFFIRINNKQLNIITSNLGYENEKELLINAGTKYIVEKIETTTSKGYKVYVRAVVGKK